MPYRFLNLNTINLFRLIIGHTSIPHSIMFHFIVLCKQLYFLQIEYLWQSCIRQIFFPIAFTHFMSLCHTLVILVIFQSLVLLLLLLLLLHLLWCDL